MNDWDEISVPRYRVLSDEGSWDTYPDWSTYLPAGNYAYNSPKSFRSSRRFKACWDKVTPNWKSKIDKGEIINSDLLEFSLETYFNPLLYRSVNKSSTETRETAGGNWGPCYPNGAGTIAPPTNSGAALAYVLEDGGSLRSEAVTAAYARVDVSELEILASLGELPETVEWFRDVLKRLIGLMTDLKRRQYIMALNRLKTSLRTRKSLRKSLKKTYTDSEDYWMEWRYAIRPLIFEVRSYLAALDTKLESATRKTARKAIFDFSSSTSYPSTTHTEYYYRANVTRTMSQSRSIRAGVLYSLDPEKMGWWTHLGLDAPVSAAWAVTRLSFVLDWFFNIGQWIASWEPRVGLNPLASWVVETRTIEIKDTWNPEQIVFPPHPTILDGTVVKNGEHTCKIQVKTRWSNPSRQVLPTFTYRGLSSAKVADLVVIGRKLASQLLR